VEARGVEPLSLKKSTKPSTCLGGYRIRKGTANRHAIPLLSVHEIEFTPTAVAPVESQPAADTSQSSRRHLERVAALFRPRELDLRNLQLFF